jgi:hypothetical protein
MTFDTAGSGIDTVVAVYVRDGDDFTEIACVDDVFFDPIGTSFQAAVTGDTVEGLTYYIQVGGFRNTLFGDGIPDTGRIRVAVRYAEWRSRLAVASAGAAPSRPSACRPTSGARWCRRARAPRHRSGRRSMTTPPACP